ncbi:DUF692 domain-containing protein [Aureivirga sp. CE67]|uniref:MNIO family bufferin maturase n=1 Tax=Aureivirga sp. CE67 TaxID=1788983 RepID=UPI0018C916AC|nr:DUF692 domain-containing protein [Aureivirga sp. CE67]
MNTINSNKRLGLPNLGLGVGLRSKHFPYLMKNNELLVDWFEIISENFMDNFGYARHVLKKVREQKPIVMHGVSMNLGSKDDLNFEYLKKLKELSDFIEPSWISDHLCWTGFANQNTHDLLPLPLNEESLKHVSNRINIVQDFLEQPIIIENPSTYLQYHSSTISEWDFLSEMVSNTNCGLLLDVNNVFVSATNHEFDAKNYIQNLPHQNIVQIHIAGPTDCGNYLVDTHDKPVPSKVWELYKLAQELTGGVSTLLEWDANIPDFPDLVKELHKAKNVLSGIIPSEEIQKESFQHIISNPIDL